MPLIKEQILNHDITLKVSGNSMLPFYKDQKTIVTLTKVDELFKYDVILYKYKGRYILHRIIKFEDDLIICRGDGLISKEDIEYKDVIAVVKSHKNNDKSINSNNKAYLFKVKLWILLRPIRRVLLKFVRR